MYGLKYLSLSLLNVKGCTTLDERRALTQQEKRKTDAQNLLRSRTLSFLRIKESNTHEQTNGHTQRHTKRENEKEKVCVCV